MKYITTKEDVVNLYSYLARAGIDVWLDGGWGVDALLGSETREHEDVDIVVQEKDVHMLRRLLSDKGYKDVERDDTREWNFVLGDELGHLVDVHVIVIDDEGNGIYGPKENGNMYPADSLSGKGVIDGVEVRCLTATYQLISHTGYKLSEKDYQDVLLLCKKFELEYPKEYEDWVRTLGI